MLSRDKSLCPGAGLEWKRRPLIRQLVGIPVVLLLLSVLWAVAPGGQSPEILVPDNPLQGRIVFEQKGCSTCHAIQGSGGGIGPDLGERRFYGTFLELAGVFWSHAPEMLRTMRQLDLPYPEFTSEEIQELTAYLYYLRYLGEPGDLYRGRRLVEEKGCLNCHSVGGKGATAGPAFDGLASYVSPLYMAQALWNHGPEMDRQIQASGLQRPTFERGEIADLSAYIRSASRANIEEERYIPPGNPKRGEQVLAAKGCLQCHSLGAQGGSLGADFAELNWDYTVTEIAGLMWNHGATMAEFMSQRKMEWPAFENREMADLIAYLYFLGFVDQPGDPEIGRELFARKGCSSCHGGAGQTRRQGPDLTRTRPFSSTADMARILWNHAPVMEARIAARVIDWPSFAGTEMADLYAYLKTLSESRPPGEGGDTQSTMGGR